MSHIDDLMNEHLWCLGLLMLVCLVVESVSGGHVSPSSHEADVCVHVKQKQ